MMFVFSHLFTNCIALLLLLFLPGVLPMTNERRLELREEVRHMFYHAYNNYKRYAFPHDELKPLSCSGRDPFGGHAVTLIDSLDMLVILGNYTEFAEAVKWLGKHLEFSKNFPLSVFELTIRVLGGLLSAHQFAVDLIDDYDGSLLNRSVDLVETLLPAFDTPTGLPYHEINPNGERAESNTTCPAAAGTLMLEFGLLSTLTGNCKYLLAAHRALESLWAFRSSLGLWGTVIDVHTGQWRVMDADVGASTDSLYEYLFKSYMFFNDRQYYDLFVEAYNSAEKHLRKDDWYIKVNHVSGADEKRLVNSLQAFWPGLQVYSGAPSDAMATFDRFHCLHQKYGFLPEAFSLDTETTHSDGYGYPLRPELIESAYFLFQATGDHRYLDFGEMVVRKLTNLTKVACGYAAIANVNSKSLEDKMDSFFLSETLKYLFLLFDPEDPMNVSSKFIFNTEAHLLKISTENHAMHAKCVHPKVREACKKWNKRLGRGPRCRRRTMKDAIESHFKCPRARPNPPQPGPKPNRCASSSLSWLNEEFVRTSTPPASSSSSPSASPQPTMAGGLGSAPTSTFYGKSRGRPPQVSRCPFTAQCIRTTTYNHEMMTRVFKRHRTPELSQNASMKCPHLSLAEWVQLHFTINTTTNPATCFKKSKPGSGSASATGGGAARPDSCAIPIGGASGGSTTAANTATVTARTFNIPAFGAFPEIQFAVLDSRVEITTFTGGAILKGMGLESLRVGHLAFSVVAEVSGPGVDEDQQPTDPNGSVEEATPTTSGSPEGQEVDAKESGSKKKVPSQREYACGIAHFGPQLSDVKVEKMLLYYPKEGSDGCKPFPEKFPAPLKEKYEGQVEPEKIAFMVDRGSCPFQRKVEHAQAAGASAAIVANNVMEGAAVQMAADVDSTNASLVTIPSVIIDKLDADQLKEDLANERIVRISFGKAGPSVFARMGLLVEEITEGDLKWLKVARLGYQTIQPDKAKGKAEGDG